MAAPHSYPPEFRAREIALGGVRASNVNTTAYAMGISAGRLHNWLAQDRIDRGEIIGTPTVEAPDLRAARKRIRELGTGLATIRQPSTSLGEDRSHPERVHPVGEGGSRRRPEMGSWRGQSPADSVTRTPVRGHRSPIRLMTHHYGLSQSGDRVAVPCRPLLALSSNGYIVYN